MPWEDKVENHFEWARIQSEREELLFELYKAEDEEEAGIYLMEMHLRNKTDLEFFSSRERKRIKELMGQLIRDTIKHRDLLGECVEEIEKKIKKEKR